MPNWYALSGLLMASCILPLAPYAERYEPPAMFAEWWHEMEHCSGRSADLARVIWYVSPTLEVRNAPAWGAWQHPHLIYLASEVVSHTDGRPPWQPWAQAVVKHEMLHDLTGTTSHGPAFDRCGVREIR